MRRVYLAFLKQVATHPVTMQVGLFVLALGVFGEMVHVKRIVDTTLGMSLGQLPNYFTGAFMHGEVLTLMAIGVMLFVALSLPLQIRAQFAPKLHSA